MKLIAPLINANLWGLSLALLFFAGHVSATDLKSLRQERLDAFQTLQSANARKHIHSGVFQRGNEVTLAVTDRWNHLSSDMKVAYVKDSMSMFFGLGGARKIPESPSDFKFVVKHTASDRTLATWDSVVGLNLKK